jgi:SAM-dependent methyltransferase
MDYDAELRLLNEVLRRAYGIRRRDRILDIGCGAGQTTREVARLAAEGEAVGVDRSAEAIARARELARAEGIRNATFEDADAENHPFVSEDFDVVISRFGTMFFRDPVAGFANIGRALRPAGRLVMMVWQGPEQNEWFLAIEEALGGRGDGPTSEASDAFSLANPAKTEEILDAAGFADADFIDVHHRSTSVATSRTPSSGFRALHPRESHSCALALHRPSARSGASSRRWSGTQPRTVSGSTRAPGS